ncbi:hypothetical protein GV054_11845 [Marinomonas mediterranea]|uniref:hypothetical protein n=1 Tax=Marinomonas mediterranea TaxID=119864 RepID=UPI002349C90F|nr:hypothetical protein [Marinomonas mediterranea]WCN13643.1 hypothetical protein GV054_11845 [Marinomonas mediterranea]
MSISKSSGFAFRDVSEISQSNVNTKKLLEQGNLKIGDHNYKVSLRNGSIAVERQHQSSGNKVKNFFSAAKEQFTHRMAEGSKFSRSDRAADVLNGIKNNEDFHSAQQARIQKIKNQRTQAQPQASSTRVNQHAPTLQSFSSFRQNELDAASHYGERANERVIKEKYQEYTSARNSNQQPEARLQTGLKRQPKAQLPPPNLMDYASFKENVRGQDRYESVHTPEHQIRQEYSRYKKGVEQEYNQTTKAEPRTRPAPKTPERYDSVSSSQSSPASSRSRQSDADYYGYESSLTKHDSFMDEVDALTRKYLGED